MTDNILTREEVLAGRGHPWSFTDVEAAKRIMDSHEALRSERDAFQRDAEIFEQSMLDTRAERDALAARCGRLEEALRGHFCECEHPYLGAQPIGRVQCERCHKCVDRAAREALAAQEPDGKGGREMPAPEEPIEPSALIATRIDEAQMLFDVTVNCPEVPQGLVDFMRRHLDDLRISKPSAHIARRFGRTDKCDELRHSMGYTVCPGCVDEPESAEPTSETSADSPRREEARERLLKHAKSIEGHCGWGLHRTPNERDELLQRATDLRTIIEADKERDRRLGAFLWNRWTKAPHNTKSAVKDGLAAFAEAERQPDGGGERSK